MDLPAGLSAGLGQRLEEILPVHFVHKNVLSAIAPAHDMVDGSGLLDP